MELDKLKSEIVMISKAASSAWLNSGISHSCRAKRAYEAGFSEGVVWQAERTPNTQLSHSKIADKMERYMNKIHHSTFIDHETVRGWIRQLRKSLIC